MSHSSHSHRPLALATALALAGACVVPAAAAEPIGDGVAPTYDEAYYATLDYYGNLTEGSVVKSYVLNGADTVTDHGTYDQVVNLTDHTEPTVQSGTTTFRFAGDSAPTHFYFEGKTAQPFETLPWTLSIHYTLNGVPTRAEDLPGKTGVVEILVDAIPNENASEYAKNNYTLEAMALFNQDDILSLEAPGAQVQLIGNLRAVLFLAFPGEEQHFAIRVGAEDFSFGGMTFLMVPATLSQLEEISKLSDRKDELEEDYHKLSDSLDTLLDAFGGMEGSLYATADGLDQLNQARGTISGGKDKVYDSLDIALDAASPLVDSIQPAASHLATAQQAIADAAALLNEMNGNVQTLKPEVENTRKLIKDLQSDLDELQELLDDLEDNGTLARARQSAKALKSDFAKLGTSVDHLNGSLSQLQSQLSDLDRQLALLDDSDGSSITIQGKSLSYIKSKWPQVQALHDQYEAAGLEGVTFQEYILAGALQQYNAAVTGAGGAPVTLEEFLATPTGQAAAEQARDADELYSMASQTPDFEGQLEQLEKVENALQKHDVSVNQLKKAVSAGNEMTSALSGLCAALGSRNLSGDLEDLSRLLEDTFDTL